MRLTKFAGFCFSILLLTISGITGAEEARLPQVAINVSPEKVVAGAPPQVFGISGNIWIVPRIFDMLVAEKILQMDNLGIARIGLGDEILSHAKSLHDLEKRLSDFRLNEFLQRYTERGGKVMIILDTVPMWASSDKSRSVRGHLERFRLSPPADYQEWSRIVSAIVRHFNGKLGLDAYYEVWNEPDVDFLGSNEEYKKFYYHSVVGVKKADKNAIVGGPGVSDFMAPKTAGGVVSTKSLQAPSMFEWLLDYCSRTAIPELGLERVPVDFLSWHGYYKNPGEDYMIFVPYLRNLLADKGYSPSTKLIDSEWNIGSSPPYPEGDLNATEVGAAYVAATLISMHEAGIDGQVFQMFVDPGVKGYSGGVFTTAGIPRANFNTFRLFSKLRGDQLETNSSDDWVKSVAYTDGERIYLLVSTMLPTMRMIGKQVSLSSRINSEKFMRAAPGSVTRKDIGAFIEKGGKLPEPLHGQLSAALDKQKKMLKDYKQKSAAWKEGVTLNIKLGAGSGKLQKMTQYIIDSGHSNGHADQQKALEQLARESRGTIKEAQASLEKLGVRKAGQSTFFKEIETSGNINRILELQPTKTKRKKIGAVYTTLAESHRKSVNDVAARKSAKLYKKERSWPASGELSIATEPYSVQLFVFE